MGRTPAVFVRSSRWGWLLGCCIWALLYLEADAKTEKYLYPQVIDQVEYSSCVEDLTFSDANGDRRVDKEEYLTAISLRSNGAIKPSGFPDLPISLVSTFMMAACLFRCDPQNPSVNLANSKLVVAFCTNMDMAISIELNGSGGFEPTFPPIEVPSENPTQRPSISPSASPSVSPSASPSSSPSASLSSSPSSSPSSSLSDPPTTSPSISPSSSPSSPPTPTPSVSPSSHPTLTPSVSPSSPPTPSPSVRPSNSPSKSPSTFPTLDPTNRPTSTPSNSPTAAPSVATPMPTPEKLACVDFQYGVSNNEGLTADDLFNERGNTFKTGLLIATQNITVEILNSTFPRDSPPRHLRESGDSRRLRNPLLAKEDHTHSLRASVEVDRPTNKIWLVSILEDANDQSQTVSEHNLVSSSDIENTPRRRNAYIPSVEAATQQMAAGSRRKLVYYTEEYPNSINSIIDNPFCAGSVVSPTTFCAVVSSSVCVLLEEGDNTAQVKGLLIRGISAAVQNGDFEAAIPPSNQFGQP